MDRSGGPPRLEGSTDRFAFSDRRYDERTVLARALSYRQPHVSRRRWHGHAFCSEFFPIPRGDTIRDAEIRYGYTEGATHKSGRVEKASDPLSWRYSESAPEAKYVDLRQPHPTSLQQSSGSQNCQDSAQRSFVHAIEQDQSSGCREVMGRKYDGAKMAICRRDKREIIVISKQSTDCGFSSVIIVR